MIRDDKDLAVSVSVTTPEPSMMCSGMTKILLSVCLSVSLPEHQSPA